MRHYFKANTDGTVTGVATTDGGFTEDLDLSDVLNQHPSVLSHRAFAEEDEDFDNFYAWDCDCPDEDVSCHCPYVRFSDYYVYNNALVEKTPLTVVLDDVAQPSLLPSAALDYAPGTPVVLKLRANVPDGTTVTVTPRSAASIIQAPTELTFTDGETGTVSLRAPAQGTTGRVIGISKLVRQFAVAIRGWA